MRWTESLCVQREEGGAAGWPRGPAQEPWAGTMLACLTQGNLLDVLQEGFNEVTVCSSHSPVPLPQRFPPNLWKRSSSTPILTRTPEQFACRALRGLRWWMLCRKTGGVGEVKGAAYHQLSWALTFSGSLPEPRRQDHIQKLSPSRRGCRYSQREILPKEIPEYWEKCSFYFRN